MYGTGATSDYLLSGSATWQEEPSEWGFSNNNPSNGYKPLICPTSSFYWWGNWSQESYKSCPKQYNQDELSGNYFESNEKWSLLTSIFLDIIFVRGTVGGKENAQYVGYRLILVFSDLSNGRRGQVAKRERKCWIKQIFQPRESLKLYENVSLARCKWCSTDKLLPSPLCRE